MKTAVFWIHTAPRIALCLLAALAAWGIHWLLGLFVTPFALLAAASFYGEYLDASAQTESQAGPRPRFD